MNRQRAEFLEKLLFRGHALEKSIFVLSFGLFCFLLGAFTMKAMTTAADIRAKLEVAKETSSKNAETISEKEVEPETSETSAATKEEESESQPKTQAVANEKEAGRSPSGTEFYFSIRVGSYSDSADAQKAADSLKTQCPDVDYKLSTIHHRYLVYCGRFDDIFTAQAVTETLKTPEKIIIRRLASEAN